MSIIRSGQRIAGSRLSVEQIAHWLSGVFGRRSSLQAPDNPYDLGAPPPAMLALRKGVDVMLEHYRGLSTDEKQRALAILASELTAYLVEQRRVEKIKRSARQETAPIFTREGYVAYQYLLDNLGILIAQDPTVECELLVPKHPIPATEIFVLLGFHVRRHKVRDAMDDVCARLRHLRVGIVAAECEQCALSSYADGFHRIPLMGAIA